MNAWLEFETLLRIVPFVGIFALMALLESRNPKRVLHANKTTRWLNNGALVVLNSLVLRLVFPAAAVGVALLAEKQGWGLWHWLDWQAPSVLVQAGVIVLSLVILDFAIWLQHLAFHRIPLLWRIHRMHHSDLDIDVTTGLRFHPIEILLSMVIKALIVLGLGIPPLAVVIFEVILNGMAMFNHSNLALSQRTDRWLRLCIVTPDMHRVHHSWHREETHSNFGFNVPWWDRVFGTYVAQPKDGHSNMTIGLPTLRDEEELRIDRLLTQPFRKG